MDRRRSSSKKRRKQSTPEGLAVSEVSDLSGAIDASLEKIAREEKAMRDEEGVRLDMMSHQERERHIFVKRLFSGNWLHDFLQPSPFTLDQLEIFTRQHIAMQLVFIQEDIRRVKEYFNGRFDEVRAMKEVQMRGISERNRRCREICEYLGIQVEVSDPKWHPSENIDTVFEVFEEEIPAQKYFSDDEMDQMLRSIAEAEERARLKREGFRELALEVMMDGVLERRTEDILKADVPKPEFMLAKEEWEWTPEEYRAADEYRSSVKELEERRKAYKKEIETELRRIIKENTAAKLFVDDKMKELFDLRIKIEMNVRLEELKICRLLTHLNHRHVLEVNEEEIKDKLKTFQSQMVQSQRGCADTHTRLVEVSRRAERITATERSLERTFRKDLGEVGIHFETLNRLYRKVPRIDIAFTGYELLVRMLNSTTNAMLRKNRTGSWTAEFNSDAFQMILRALEELDNPAQSPPGLPRLTWERFCHLRRERLFYMYQGEMVSSELNALNEYLANCKAAKADITDKITRLMSDLTAHRDARVSAVHDFEFQTVFPQGLIELEGGERWEDFFDAVMISVEAVAECNQTIRRIGKIQALKETKRYHTLMKQTEWQFQRAELALRDAEEKRRDIATQKVTREVLGYLEHYDNYRMRQQDKLDRIRKLFEMSGKFEDQLQQILNGMEREILAKDRANTRLTRIIDEGNLGLNEARNKCNVEEAKETKFASKRRVSLLMETGSLMRKIAKTCEQVMVMESELDRLYKRTFPVL